MEFKPRNDGKDARFYDLVHLVNRNYNTLKEVGIPGDMGIIICVDYVQKIARL